MKYFCSKCGKTTAYNLDLPKFCSACGQSFASTHDKPIQTTIYKNELKLKENNKSINIQDDILYNNEGHKLAVEMLNFKNIKPAFKIDVYKPLNETFGTLIDNPCKPLENNDIQFNNVNRSQDEILADFKKEAGSLRSNE